MMTSGVDDVQASAMFYESGLGFPRIESEPTVAFFNLNGSWLGLYDREALAEDATVSPRGEGFNLQRPVRCESVIGWPSD
jgi:catechol 2,3-dioxygenase-like lactoylglutathione lyase family enzyme